MAWRWTSQAARQWPATNSTGYPGGCEHSRVTVSVMDTSGRSVTGLGAGSENFSVVDSAHSNRIRRFSQRASTITQCRAKRRTGRP